jgi:hypothetical protein
MRYLPDGKKRFALVAFLWYDICGDSAIEA